MDQTAQHTASDTAGELMVTAHGLTLQDLRMTAYRDITVALEAGRAHAVCAEDKGGKSELLLTFAGLMKPSAGACRVAGHDVATRAGRKQVRKLASLAFFDHVNEVEQALSVRTVTSAELGLAGRRSNRAATEAYLRQWGFEALADTIVGDLARYDYDRLGIVLAMVHEPALLVVDDIERDLTEHESEKLAHELVELAHDRGVTVVCGVIDYDLAVRFDTATCLTDGAQAQRVGYQRKHMKREVA